MQRLRRARRRAPLLQERDHRLVLLALDQLVARHPLAPVDLTEDRLVVVLAGVLGGEQLRERLDLAGHHGRLRLADERRRLSLFSSTPSRTCASVWN